MPLLVFLLIAPVKYLLRISFESADLFLLLFLLLSSSRCQPKSLRSERLSEVLSADISLPPPLPIPRYFAVIIAAIHSHSLCCLARARFPDSASVAFATAGATARLFVMLARNPNPTKVRVLLRLRENFENISSTKLRIASYSCQSQTQLSQPS